MVRPRRAASTASSTSRVVDRVMAHMNPRRHIERAEAYERARPKTESFDWYFRVRMAPTDADLYAQNLDVRLRDGRDLPSRTMIPLYHAFCHLHRHTPTRWAFDRAVGTEPTGVIQGHLRFREKTSLQDVRLLLHHPADVCPQNFYERLVADYWACEQYSEGDPDVDQGQHRAMLRLGLLTQYLPDKTNLLRGVYLNGDPDEFTLEPPRVYDTRYHPSFANFRLHP